MPVYLLVVVWPKSLEASLPRTDGEVRDGTFARLIRKIVSVNLLALPRKARNSCFQELLAGEIGQVVMATDISQSDGDPRIQEQFVATGVL